MQRIVPDHDPTDPAYQVGGYAHMRVCPNRRATFDVMSGQEMHCACPGQFRAIFRRPPKAARTAPTMTRAEARARRKEWKRLPLAERRARNAAFIERHSQDSKFAGW